MAIREFIVNAGYDNSRTVKAAEVRTTDDFVDFLDGVGLVLRLRKSDVYTVERQQEG